jgi:hypothetical protein
VVMQGGYHGRTSGAAALTRSKTSFFKGTGPLMVSLSLDELTLALRLHHCLPLLAPHGRSQGDI